ncbi:hypothetical protein [Streptomyces roseolus]|uniref:hypothetical protein n=1 Tax=Streptomyces roseolus TaxID=67358 RepID=UPI001673EFE5|nr:hypothetical protein [Streptomyces roseolus]GGR51696.1 hypothetical protein GCM10010282_50790 [Streptomyces roseolus]
MDDEAEFENNLFLGGEPTDVVFDALWVTYSQFWLTLAAADRFVDVSTAIPAADSIATNGDAVGIPTRSSAGNVKVALSAWPATPPDGQGDLLGSSSVVVEGRELHLVNVEGREPGPVLVLEDDGSYEVRVWRSEPAGTGATEYFDIRVWQDPASS